MHITLHYTPGTRAIRPRWLLEELDIPYELNRLDLYGGECNKPEYKAIHPLGQVPALEINGQIQLESGAMLHWLADHFIATELAPTPGDPTRINYEQWMFFTPGTLEPPAFYAILHSKILPKAQRIEDFVPWAMQRYLQSVEVVDNALDGKTFLLGDKFSAADIMVGSTLMWIPDALLDFPCLQEYVNRLKERDAFIRATKD
jgi:glutathione S-transferase